MTDLIPRAAVLEILRTPAASDTFPDMIARVEALEGCGVRSSPEDTFYIDCEFDGHNGPLLSIAMVRGDGANAYVTTGAIAEDPWVIKNVLPILGSHSAHNTWRARPNEVGSILRNFIWPCRNPVIIADSPVDIGRFCQAISTGDGGGWASTDFPGMTFEVRNVDCYPTALEGAVQHNAWWDAMALRAALEPVAQPETGPGELLPCPFCGGKARYRHKCGVECSVCNANVVDVRRESEAIAAWNRRATREPGTEPTPGQFTTMCLAIEDVVTGRGFDVDPWQPIETAPKDGTWILARYADIEDGRRQHWPGRVFVVKHMGYTAGQGYDMGWALFPGMGVGDESLSEWMPLPGETTSAIPEEVKAYLRNALMVGGWRGERE